MLDCIVNRNASCHRSAIDGTRTRYGLIEVHRFLSISNLVSQRSYLAVFLLVSALTGLSWFYLLNDDAGQLITSGLILQICGTQLNLDLLRIERPLTQLWSVWVHWFTMNLAMMLPGVIVCATTRTLPHLSAPQIFVQTVQFIAMSAIFAVAATFITMISAKTFATPQIWIAACVCSFLLRAGLTICQAPADGAFVCATNCFTWMCVLMAMGTMNITWMAALTIASLLRCFLWDKTTQKYSFSGSAAQPSS
jgi:hypothetical protein